MTRFAVGFFLTRFFLTCLLPICLAAGLAAPAAAETVRLLTAGGGYGHGWMFVSEDGYCRIATPAHVIERQDGRLGEVVALDARGDERRAVDPVQPDPDVDLAFLTVAVPQSERLCTSSRLGLDQLDGRLARWREGFVTTTIDGESSILRVERRARSVDPRQGAFFAVTPVRAQDRIVQGMSGSAVLDSDAAGTPMGLLIKAVEDENAAVALRFDLVKALANRVTAAQAAAPAQPPEAVVVVVAGRSRDAASHASNIVAPGGGVWRVRPVEGRARVIVIFAAPMRFSSVSLNPAPGDGPETLEVAASGALDGANALEGPYHSVGFCRKGADNGLSCRTPPTRARVLRLTLTGPDAGFSVGALTLR